MATNFTKADQHVHGDQQERNLLLSIGDVRYDSIDEKGDYDLSIKPNIHDTTKNLITNESRYNTISGYESSSCTLSSTEDTHGDDVSMKSTESSEREIIMDKESNIQNEDHKIGNAVNEPIKEYDPTIDERLPGTVTLLTTPEGGKLYLIGTAHFSIESQNDVSKIIQAVQPHIVVVELCKARIGIMQLNEEVMYRYAKDINYKTIMDTVKKEGLYNGLLHILMLRMAARVASQLGMPPGGEFRRAFEEVKKVPNCIVHLADRPINITIQRAIRSLSWWQTIKLVWHMSMMNDAITQEDVELCKERSMLDDMLAGMKEEFPVLGEVFVKERDIYLTNSLQLACSPYGPPNRVIEPRVVGIVGLGHVPGIVENWGKVKPADIPPIMRIPPPSLSGKILKFTFKASILGAVVYIGCKVVGIPATITFHSIKSSVQGLLQVGAAR